MVLGIIFSSVFQCPPMFSRYLASRVPRQFPSLTATVWYEDVKESHSRTGTEMWVVSLCTAN